MLLVRSIDEIPQPIAYKTHNAGLRMVQDLSVARRFIMQKLAVGMLNIVDQFHTEVRNLMFDSHALFQTLFSPFFQLELAHIFYCILSSLL